MPLSLLRQLELLGKHHFALLVLVRGPGFWESDTARSLLRQQLPHSFPRCDQKQEYDKSLETIQQVRRYPDEKERRLPLLVVIDIDVRTGCLKDRLPKFLHLRPDGERYQFKDPGDTHDEHQFDIKHALESQDSQLASRVIAILMPQAPASHPEIDHV